MPGETTPKYTPYIAVHKKTNDMHQGYQMGSFTTREDDAFYYYHDPRPLPLPPLPEVNDPPPKFLGVVREYGRVDACFVTSIKGNLLCLLKSNGDFHTAYISGCELVDHAEVPNSPELVAWMEGGD
jgi:hypothetical protein